MSKNEFVSVIIAAAGQGKRMNASVSKQYLMLLDKPVLVHTLEIFENCKNVDEIIVVAHPEEIEYCKEEIVEGYGFKKIKSLVIGGKERQESIMNGLQAVDPRCDIVLVHDGARPFLTDKMIQDTIEGVRTHRAVGLGVPVKDTIKIVDNQEMILNTPDRSTLWAIHTPQAFEYNLLMHAHEEAKREGFLGTDDTVLVERIGIGVKMIFGNYENIKLTTPEDLYIGEMILKNRK